tara:strand:+ start:36907 stop:37122 length:216 start_codon:yes stop_codon:yes gene_type:complete
MTNMMIASNAAFFLGGLVVGLYLHYIIEYKPLLERYIKLSDIVVGMKRQGFVPMFEVEQPKEVDLTDPHEY